MGMKETCRNAAHLLAPVTYESDLRVCRIGRGSDGFEIFGLREPEALLERGSSGATGERDPDGPLLNHFAGLEKKVPRPGDGEREGNGWVLLGEGGMSPGLSVCWAEALRAIGIGMMY
jgi:hypothetical protein